MIRNHWVLYNHLLSIYSLFDKNVSTERESDSIKNM